jgi:hypothetical protein
LGTAAAALKRTIPGDFALLSLDEILQASQSVSERVQR